jgi:hypothetical protein
VSREEVEGAGKIADDQIEATVTVLVHCEGAGADVLSRVAAAYVEGFAVRTLQDFRPTKCPVCLAV